MHPTMNVTGEFIFFWYVIAPTLILVIILVLALSRNLGTRLHRTWKHIRDAWHLRLPRRRPSLPPETVRRSSGGPVDGGVGHVRA